MHDLNRSKAEKAEWVRPVAVLLCGCASMGLYRGLARTAADLGSAEPTGAAEVFPWVKTLTRDMLDAAQAHPHGLSKTFEYMGCCAGLFVLYGIVVWLAGGVRRGWGMLLLAGLPVVFMGMLLCAPAMVSSDVYAYAHYGWLLGVKGVDAHGPAAVAVAGTNSADPFSLDGYYDFVASVYGPFWTLISAGLVLAARSHVGLTVAMFRALEAASALGCARLIWVILARLSPQRALAGTVLFLWNPLVITESALGGHNDTCMMLFALLAVWLHLRGCKAWAVVALALSALIKVITWPLVPLCMLMTLRSGAGWKPGAWFLCRAGAGTLAAVVLVSLCARMSVNGLTMHTASSAQFYENNYHELLFKGLRRVLGEQADTLDAPMDFKTYWVQTWGHAELHDGVSKKTKVMCDLKEQQPLLVISNEDSDDWLKVYDPANGMRGYVDWPHLSVIPDPPDAEKDPAVRRMSGWPPDWPTVQKANRLIRLVTWGLFMAFGLLAAWKTKDIESFIFWGTAFFLASLLLVFTKIWPWYLVWPLAYGALMPEGNGMRMAVLLSAGMIVTYAMLDYPNTPLDWLYVYRSIPSIVLPAAAIGIYKLWEIARRRAPT